MKTPWMPIGLVLLAALAAPAGASLRPGGSAPMLDVALLVHQREVQVSATKGFRATTGSGGSLGVQWGGVRIPVTATLAGLKYRGSGGNHSAIRILPAGGGLLALDGKPYRGTLELKADGKGGLDVVNHVEIEPYLWGVVKAEMSATAPAAALRAQAVAARTFAMKNQDLYRSRGYGLKATEQSQVYGGVSVEDPRTMKAVNDTRGVVATFEGRLIEALYHAACGGHTENNEDVWSSSEPIPYERARRCWGCQSNPQAPWSAEFDFGTIQRKLMEFSWDVGPISRIDFTHTKTGRVKDVMVHSSTGVARVPGNNFRLMIDRRVIRSLMVDGVGPGTGQLLLAGAAPDEESEERPAAGDDRAIRSIIAKYMMFDPVERVLKLSGRGFGHGVGLCQYGAKQLAMAGKTHQEVLRTYYSGIELRRAY